MKIGIPKEILSGEQRVAAIPATVRKYIDLGFDVLVEASAGEGVQITNEDYLGVGAKIISDPESLFAESDIVIKVKQPVFNDTLGKHEASMLRDGTTLIAFLHPAAPENYDMVKRLKDKNITALTMDGIPRISRAQKMDALSSMSAVTGYKSVIMAADLFPKFIPMIGTAIGTIKPAQFVVIGTGVVGLQAIATAKRLGGVVKSLDIRKNACTEAESLGAKIVDFDIPQELVLAPGGYAKSLENDWLEIERKIISPIIEEADVIILSALVPGEIAPILITEQMVSLMKTGAVVMDISIDQGGNCELTEPGRISLKLGVNICGIQNIPGRIAVHASWLYANNMFYYIENLFKNGSKKIDLADEIVESSLVTHENTIHHKGTLKAMKNMYM